MTGVPVAAASEAEWLQARRQGVTASEIAVLMGLSPYGSPYALWHRKAGNLPEQEDNDAMAIGRHMESYVAESFQGRHPEFYVAGDGRGLYRHPERAWQMATPDRIVWEWTGDKHATWVDDDPLAVLECKVSASGNTWDYGEDGSDRIPVHYRCQVLWQCDVLGVSAWWLACLDWNRRKVREYHGTIGEAERADLELMRDEAAAFRARLAAGDPPEVDWRPATAAALKHLHPDLEDREVVIPRPVEIQYRAAVRRYKEAEQRKDEMTNRMLALIGSGHYAMSAKPAPDGQPVKIATRQVYDQKGYYRQPCTIRKLVPARTGKEEQ